MISRDPPADVKRILRTEVAFGCPICRKPFLTWHHFDPPWRERHHQEPQGMIALCREHADQADGGIFSTEQLRLLKHGSYSVQSVKAPLAWKGRFLIRVGGIYMGGTTVPVRLGGCPLIRLSHGSGGLLELSFALRAENGRILLKMEDNSFEAYPDSLHDLIVNVRANKISVWPAESDIGLDLCFRRLTLDKLRSLLSKDRDRVVKHSRRLLSPHFKSLPPDIQEHVARLLSREEQPSWVDSLPAAIRDSYRDSDPVGAAVLKHAVAKCADDEGKIPFLDFRRLHSYCCGRSINIRNGVEQNGNSQVQYTALVDCATGVDL